MANCVCPDRAVETAATRGAKSARADSGFPEQLMANCVCPDRAVDGELRSHSSKERREVGLRRLRISRAVDGELRSHGTYGEHEAGCRPAPAEESFKVILSES